MKARMVVYRSNSGVIAVQLPTCCLKIFFLPFSFLPNYFYLLLMLQVLLCSLNLLSFYSASLVMLYIMDQNDLWHKAKVLKQELIWTSFLDCVMLTVI